MHSLRRVVITGMGVCSSLGFSEKEVLQNIQGERVSFRRPSFDPDVVVSPISDFDVRSSTGPFKNIRYLTRGGQFALASAIQAVRDAEISKTHLSEAGLFMGAGPNMDMGNELQEITSGRISTDTLKALWMLRFLPNTAASLISEYLGIHGENLTVTTACAASLQAIGEAFRRIRHGYLDTALAGGGDSRINPGGILAFKKANALYKGKGDPESASRPFDQEHKGFVPGEGGAVFVLEEMNHARARNAKIYAEIRGYSASMDGHHMTAPDPEGKSSEKAVLHALKESGMTTEDIHMICAHGTSTRLNDEMEASLIKRIFKDKPPMVLALKSWIGHLATACGAVELALMLTCMKNRFIPRVRNLKIPCHPDVNFAKESKSHEVNTVLLENFGFGGQNGVLVFKRSAV